MAACITIEMVRDYATQKSSEVFLRMVVLMKHEADHRCMNYRDVMQQIPFYQKAAYLYFTIEFHVGFGESALS